jgi:hypothetical protein
LVLLATFLCAFYLGYKTSFVYLLLSTRSVTHMSRLAYWLVLLSSTEVFYAPDQLVYYSRSANILSVLILHVLFVFYGLFICLRLGIQLKLAHQYLF